jgi:hypothetical protein
MDTWGVNTSSSMAMLGMSTAMALLMGTCETIITWLQALNLERPATFLESLLVTRL